MNQKELLDVLASWKKIMADNRDYLIEIDGVVGDGDLGLTMSDGFAAAYDAVASGDEKDLGKMLYFAGKAMSTAVPSTMGTLMASGLMSAGKELRGKEELDANGVATLFQAYFDGVMNRGSAKVGDKTFLDGLHPAVESLTKDAAAGADMKTMAEHAKKAAEEGFLATKGMLAVHGRAATRGEASRELLDPGAAVAKLLMEGFASAVS